MKVKTPLSVLDRPNSYIGKSNPRAGARQLLEGRGVFVDDLNLPRMLHVVFCRSPYAHAKIVSTNTERAASESGVVRVVTGAELVDYCSPWVGVLTHLQGLKSASQHAIAVDRACWQGEAICAVLAETRAQAEDAAALVQIEYEELPVVVDMETALDETTPLIHPELGDNLCFQREVNFGEVDKAFTDAHTVIEETFHFGRHTGVCLEARGIVADYNPATSQLTVYLSAQAPHMMKNLYAKHFGISEDNVRVICKDVGGSFGIKVHTYPDEMATAALSIMLNRPVKFIADRYESFVTDIHARDHRVSARMALDKDGKIKAIDMDDLTGIGPYSVYPRTSGIEANQIVNLTGGPYTVESYRARAQVVFTNKNVMCQYRAVGHPVACAVGEGLVDAAARTMGLDPVEIRRRNLIPDDAYPYTYVTGLPFEKLSHHQCLDKILEMMDYEVLREEQEKCREQEIYRGIGFASMIEVTNPSPAFYGVGGAFISSQEGCTIRMDHTGGITCTVGVTEQGQGSDAVVAQVAASAVGVTLDKVRVVSGDTDVVPYGGGTWASRAAGIGGEAALRAGKALRENILEVAAIILQAEVASLDVQNDAIVDMADGTERLPLSELGRIVYFRGDTLPDGVQPELVSTRHYVPKAFPFSFTNGIEAIHVEVDVGTGIVKLLKCWVVDDCGTIINPLLVDEQIRGGVVQGLGGALYEECLYDEKGQYLNATMADYLVPMAAEMPDIEVGHVETPTTDSELGAKGVGEAGTAGAPAAVMNAINDALSPFNAQVTAMPFTPERILRALGKI